MTRHVCPLALNDARIRISIAERSGVRGVLIDVIEVINKFSTVRSSASSFLYHKFRMIS